MLILVPRYSWAFFFKCQVGLKRVKCKKIEATYTRHIRKIENQSLELLKVQRAHREHDATIFPLGDYIFGLLQWFLYLIHAARHGTIPHYIKFTEFHYQHGHYYFPFLYHMTISTGPTSGLLSISVSLYLLHFYNVLYIEFLLCLGLA